MVYGLGVLNFIKLKRRGGGGKKGENYGCEGCEIYLRTVSNHGHNPIFSSKQ